ncbi:putative phage protein (TIGR02218 family) [Agrobacterium vitis]|nr:putative phage protein (TIGR02218 family) [Agrobacterium vitis]MBE1439193.1 putative phage protein (TIGR02218 family) [Agrobacterium vitis]
MRVIPAALASHLAGDATTLCTCWRVTRTDRQVFGFTDHDRDVHLLDTTFHAASGFSASDAEAETGLAAPSSEVAGAFSSDVITEADLIAGRYDGARIEVYRVNWQDPSQYLLLKVQEMGEVKRQSGQFTAELRSFAAKLSQEQGRTFGRRCDAVLGDRRCGVNMSTSGRTAHATVVTMDGSDRITVSGLETYADDHFRYGKITVASGAEAGLAADIETSRAGDDGTVLTLWLPLEVVLKAGDALTLTIGCDKSFAACRDTFANATNFRGFPHMPGTDFAYSYVGGQVTHDGSVLFE